MLDRLGSLITELKGCVGGLAADRLTGDEAMGLCTRFAEVERVAAAGRLITADRVAATEVWRRGGTRTAADWVARQTGLSSEHAKDGLETAARLRDCSIVAEELQGGRLSEAQAQAIVDAVAVRPEAEGRLVEFARSNSLRRLREECRRAKNADDSAADEHRKVHASRDCRTWIGRDGAFCGSFRFTADAGAAFSAALEERKGRHVAAARKEGRREPFGACAADALVELVTEDRGGTRQTRPKHMVIVHVAYEAIVRGALGDGEICEIAGVGPVPLDVARALSTDSVLRVLVTKGGQPMAVTPGVRTIPRALRLLLEARYPTCAVPGCDVKHGLEADHVKPFAQLGPTDLDNCVLLCKRHHAMKTYLGYRLARKDGGSWAFLPPDDYRDPEPPDPAMGELVAVDPWTGEAAATAGEFSASGGGAPRKPAVSEEGERTRPAWSEQLALVGRAGPAP